MAIQIRRGDYLNFDPQKMKPGELAVVQTNDPEGDGTALYFCTTAGTVKRLASYEDVVSMLYNIADEVLERAEESAERAEEAAGAVILSVIEAYVRSGQTPLSSTWLATESASGPVITPDEKHIYTLMNYSSPYSRGSQFKWSGSTYVKINDGGFVNVTGVKGEMETAFRTGDVIISKLNLGLPNVENKSSETIREELTKSNVIAALGYTPLQTHQSIKQDGITGATVTRLATCSTAAGTVAKTASVLYGSVTIGTGTRITVLFTYANTADNPTLNINGLGAKDIYFKGVRITTGSEKTLLNNIVDFVYTNGHWELIASAPVIDNITEEEIDAIITGVEPDAFNYLLEWCYPVGSYFETSISTFNPNTVWGGTWVLDPDAGSMIIDDTATTGTVDGDLVDAINDMGFTGSITATNSLYRWRRTA